MKTIWPTERLPLDFAFTLATGDTISTPQKSVYDITDNAKTDLSTTLVDASGVNFGIIGNKVRLAVHQMTLGKTYHFQAEAETANGQALINTMLVQCGYESIRLPDFAYGGRRRYTVNLEDKLPGNVTIDASDTTNFTAYDSADLTTNIWNSLSATVLASGNVLYIDIENLDKNHTYIINALAVSTLDSVTGSTYKAGKQLVVLCREF